MFDGLLPKPFPKSEKMNWIFYLMIIPQRCKSRSLLSPLPVTSAAKRGKRFRSHALKLSNTGQIEWAIRFLQNVDEAFVVYFINCEKSKFGPNIP